MKHFIAIFLIFFLAVGCDNDDNNYHEYHLEYSPVKSVELPDEFILGQTYEMKHLGAAVKAFAAYKMAFPLAVKGAETKAIMSGLDNIDNALVTEADAAFAALDWETGMHACKGVLEASELLESKGKASVIADEATRDDWVFYTGLSAKNSQNFDVAKEYMAKLVDKGSTKGEVYEAMFSVYNEEGMRKRH